MSELLQEKLVGNSLNKILDLHNQSLETLLAEYVGLCNPDSVYVCDDSDEDAAYIRQRSLEMGEERALGIAGHSAHFDGYNDQARDKEKTRYLLRKGSHLGKTLNTVEYEKGIAEVTEFLRNAMAGKQMYVCFFCLGPVGSPFSLSCVQITDSAYVAHSEYLLYRRGYEQFKRLNGSTDYFRFIHSAGVLENNVSKNVDKRRVYIDLDKDIVYSTNTQYAGNTVGLKKLAMRLAINKSKDEGWLTEHMFVMGVKGPEDRMTYFTGAFPSACGKTSTAMLPGESIVGDDIAYLRERDGRVYAVNVESGIFGIISDVSEKDDPVIWQVLTTQGEVIFSNILVVPDNRPYWQGMGIDAPDSGVNFSGEWQRGKVDAKGRKIPLAHKNARYTIKLDRLANCDPNLHNPDGVPIGGFIYGGRDSDTSVPVVEALNYEHGILMIGASLESETTSATLGAEGVRRFNLMSILDFLSYPLGEYILNNIAFGTGLKEAPKIFGVNYFLKNNAGKYLNGKLDKHVWLKWAELRVHNDVKAIETPIGYIPNYTDIRQLFQDVLGKAFIEKDYVEQFTIRVPELREKMTRIKQVYEKIVDPPEMMFTAMQAQDKRLAELQKSHGEHVSPFDLV